MSENITMMNDERKFLHEIANPLAAALFIADILLEDVKNEEQELARDTLVAKLEQVNGSLERLRELLKNRRALLISRTTGGEQEAKR